MQVFLKEFSKLSSFVAQVLPGIVVGGATEQVCKAKENALKARLFSEKWSFG